MKRRYARRGMSERQFLEEAAKQRTASAIRGVEAQTAVEVVVAVRRRAGRYLTTSVAFGAACAALAFGVMWFSPRVYDVRTMPLDAAVTLVLGTVVAMAAPGLRRLLTPKRSRERNAERAAGEAFSALGIAKTRARTGLLVYVALFERTAVLVPDTGIPAAVITGSLAAIRRGLTGAVAALDVEAFLAALGELGPACAAVLPRRADDENELCDDVA
jgi:putative membrane protein